MEEAHDLMELKKLIAQLGLKDERRQSARYSVDIAGHYHADPVQSTGRRGKCRLVDVSREGLSVKLDDENVTAGTILHLELPMGGTTMDIATRVVYIEQDEGCFMAGLQATGENDDVIQQLFTK